MIGAAVFGLSAGRRLALSRFSMAGNGSLPPRRLPFGHERGKAAFSPFNLYWRPGGRRSLLQPRLR